MELRAATPADEAELVRLDVATWSPLVSPGAAPDPEADFFSERRTPSDVLVAAEGERLLGYVILQLQRGMPSHDHVLLINGVAVDPAAQGRGVGSTLVELCQREAMDRGVSKVSLRVLAGNTRARGLYASRGFEVEGVLRGEFRIEGALVDDVLMAWFPTTTR